MSQTISETKACDLLARIFRSRGYRVVRNFTFREYGVEFHADGWDPQARVGFEFLTSEDDDHDDLTLAEYQTLMAAQLRGELALFIIDEVEPLSTSELFEAAEEFLDEVAAGRLAGRRPRAPAAARAGKRAARRPAAKRAKKRTRAGAAGQKAGAGNKKKAAQKRPPRKAGKAAATGRVSRSGRGATGPRRGTRSRSRAG